jgi:TP901 family phage tail tape measure protein
VSVVANVAINVDSRGAVGKLKDVDNAAQKLDQTFKGVGGRLRDASGKFIKLGDSAQSSASKIDLLSGAIGKLSIGLALVDAARRYFKGFNEAEKAAASVRTLGVDSKALEGNLLGLSQKLGGLYSQTQLLTAAYDVASSGFANAADNAKVLEAAAKGATGGLSDINTVADAVTSVLNTYGKSAAEAGALVDGFIQTQNDGKITLNQYANQIGKLAPTAAAAGVGIQELNAAVATITPQGVRVEAAVAGLNQALVAILKPSQEAEELAKSLGIQFNEAGLRAKGFGGLLEEVKTKTGGSTTQLVKLFGSVDALKAVLPLVNDDLVKYNKNVERQANVSGVADKATQELGGTVSSEISKMVNQIGNLVRGLDTVLGPSLGGIVKLINFVISEATKGIYTLGQLFSMSPNKTIAKEMVQSGQLGNVARAVPGIDETIGEKRRKELQNKAGAGTGFLGMGMDQAKFIKLLQQQPEFKTAATPLTPAPVLPTGVVAGAVLDPKAAAKAAKAAEKAAKLAQKLAEDSAQYQIQIDDQIFKNQVELDKMRYDLQRQLQEKQLSNWVNKFTGAAKEQAGIIQSMVMGSASFDAQIKDIENKIKEAQQRLQSGTRMNQVQSTTVGGGGFLVGSTGKSSGPHLDLRGSDREGVIREAAAIIKVWQKQGLPYIELPNAKINVKNMLNELQLLQALRKEQMAHDVTRGKPIGASGNAIDISVPAGTKVPVAAGTASFQGLAGYAATSLATGNRMLHGLPQSKAGGGGVAGGVPGQNVDQTKAEIQGLIQQLALLKSQSKSLKAEDLAAGILASTSAFREQTAQLGLQTEAFTLRNRLQMEGVKPELIEGELKLLEVRQQLNDRLKPFNELLANGTMTQEQYAQATDGIKVAAENAAIAIQTYTAATAAASSPIQQFIGSAQTQLKDLESVAVRVSQGIGDAVGNSLTKGIQGLVEGTTTAQQVFADFLKSIGDILMQEGTKMIATYTAIAIARQLAGLFGGGSSAIAGGSTYGGAASSSIFSAGTGTAFGGMSIPGFAEGGRPPVGKASLVGEKGPELFVPSSSGTIIPADATAAAMARYQRQGSGRGAGGSGSDAMGASEATPVLSMSFETTRFLGQDYVSTEQLQAAMAATERRATTAGAKAGAAQVTSRLQQSPSYRRQVGLR